MIAALGVLALAALPAADALAFHSSDAGNPHNRNRALLAREITSDVSKATAQSWDFIIAGGGLAGLAVAARLSEWSNQTVLVVEAGTDGSEVKDQLTIPGYSYLNGLMGKGLPQDWAYTTVEQAGAGNNAKRWPRGKVLGGSGATNGMFWGRGSTEDYDAWATLNQGSNITWNWEEVHKYINKAENYNPPPQAQIEQFHMVVDPSVHGDSGPIHTGNSQFIYPAVSNWIPAWQSVGMTAKDINGGSVHGVMICPSIINTYNQSRSDSKTGYIDPLPPRPNLMILTGQQVTKVNFNGTDANGNQVASGVTFAASEGAQSYTVNANKEVILAGGTVGSPQILQLSGIGPKSVLEAQGITVLKDLPVGYNLQDHVSGAIYFRSKEGVDTWGAFSTNQEERAAALEEWRNNGTGKWTYVNEAVGYVDMADISGGASGATAAANGIDVNALVQQVTSAYNLPASVQKGLAKQYDIQKQMMTQEVGQLEIILTMLGGDANTVGIQVAVQHTFSRGTLFINSGNPFAKPTIDPAYFSLDIDSQIALGGLKWTRALAQTDAMKNLIEAEFSAADSEETLLTNYKAGAGTEYHPCGTNSMLPEADGGVVDTNLLVYGTKNVRVIDASIIPLNPAAHLMATTYGIAEKGADIVKAAHVAPPPEPSTSSSSLPAAETSASDVTNNSTSALSSSAQVGAGFGLGVALPALLAAVINFF